MSNSIRLSSDLEEMVEQVREAFGFKDKGEAARAILRKYGPIYLSRKEMVTVTVPAKDTPLSHYPRSTPSASSNDALDDLDSLLSM